jgi:hypothetical protein
MSGCRTAASGLSGVRGAGRRSGTPPSKTRRWFGGAEKTSKPQRGVGHESRGGRWLHLFHGTCGADEDRTLILSLWHEVRDVGQAETVRTHPSGSNKKHEKYCARCRQARTVRTRADRHLLWLIIAGLLALTLAPTPAAACSGMCARAIAARWSSPMG